MDLNTFIYDFNLVATQTVDDIQTACIISNNGRRKEINYGNCVSLYDLASMFNNSYLDFLKDSGSLNEIIGSLGEKVSYISHIASDDFTSLCLDVTKPYSEIFDERYAVVYFFNNKGNYFASSNNGKIRLDEDYKSRKVDLDEDAIIQCLDIVKKNGLFFDAYNDLKNKFVFGNGCTVIFSKINGELFNELKTFTLTFGNSYMNSTDCIEVKFRLGDDFDILYDDSKVIMSDEEITDVEKKKAIISELLSCLYINSNKLSELYQNEDFKKVYVKEDK